MDDYSGQTPFKLVYGSEAPLPVEIGVQTTTVKHLIQEENEQSRLLDLELIDEVRENALVVEQTCAKKDEKISDMRKNGINSQQP